MDDFFTPTQSIPAGNDFFNTPAPVNTPTVPSTATSSSKGSNNVFTTVGSALSNLEGKVAGFLAPAKTPTNTSAGVGYVPPSTISPPNKGANFFTIPGNNTKTITAVNGAIDTLAGKIGLPATHLPQQALGLPDTKNPNAITPITIDGNKYLTNSGGGIVSPFLHDDDAAVAIQDTQFRTKQLQQQKSALSDEAKTLDTSDADAVNNFNTRVNALNTSSDKFTNSLATLSDQLEQYNSSNKVKGIVTSDAGFYGSLGLTQEQQLEKGVTDVLMYGGLFTGATEALSAASSIAELTPMVLKAITQGGLGIGAFYGLERAEQGIKQNASDPEKLLLFLGNLVAAGGLVEGLTKAVPKLGDALFRSTIEKYNLPKQVYFDPASVVKTLGSGEMSELARALSSEKGGLDVQKVKEAAKNGVTIEVPAEKVMTVAEKPFWTKIKQAFGVESNTGTTIESTGEAKTTVRGLLPEGKTIEPSELNDLAEQVKSKSRAQLIEEPSLISTPDVLDNSLIQEAKKYSSAEEFTTSRKPLYHGTDKEFSDFKEGSFFSTDKNFAKDYGSVGEEKYLDSKKTFDLTNKEDFNAIVGKEGIEDSYDGKVYKTFEAYKNSPSFGNDTWELTEPYLNKIKSLGYDTARVFEGGIENFAALDKNIIKNKDQLTDIYNQAHGLSTTTKSSLIDSIRRIRHTGDYGTQRYDTRGTGERIPGNINNEGIIRENSEGLQYDGGGTPTYKDSQSRELDGSGSSTEFTEDERGSGRVSDFLAKIQEKYPEAKGRRFQIEVKANKLQSGEETLVDRDTPAILHGLGFPDAITDNIGEYVRHGAFSYLKLADTVNGLKSYGGYGYETLILNPEVKDTENYTSGRILRHEMTHSFLEKLPGSQSLELHQNIDTENLGIQAWKLSGMLTYNRYYQLHVNDILDNVLLRISDSSLAKEIVKRAGFVTGKTMTLPEYIKETNTDLVAQRLSEINKMLDDEGVPAISLKAYQTIAVDENAAMVGEWSPTLHSDDPLVSKFLTGSKDNTLHYGDNRSSNGGIFNQLQEEEKSPQDILKEAEEKSKNPIEQKTRFMALDRAVEDSSTHNEFMDAVRKDPVLTENMEKLLADLHDNGYSNAIDYFVKRKIDFNTNKGIVPQRIYAKNQKPPRPRDMSGELNRTDRDMSWKRTAEILREPELKDAPEIIKKGKELGFTVPELESDRVADIFDIVAQTELLKNHPAKAFFKYVNSRGQLPELISDNPGVYDTKMKALMEKQGIASIAEAQKLVDDYVDQNTKLSELYNDKYDPIEIAQRDSVHRTPFSEMEKERLAAKGGDEAKPMDTVVDHDSVIKKGNDVMKKVGEHDLFRTPDRVLEKIGLKAESDLIKKQYGGYLKELPKNIDKISQWAKRVPSKDSARKIFDYLDGKLLDADGFMNPDVLTAEEKKVGDEIKSWLEDWAHRLGLKPHERLANYITHIFENDLLSKEFDVDFAKIITDKVAGSVYDPFLEQRLGKLGYVRDAWRSLDAYVKRATRKVYMDPALSRIKIASEDLDLQSIAYVKNYVDQINMRPTDRENRWDNTIKQIVGYKFGGRPTARISKSLRQMVFRGSLGLNLSSALRNLSQSANSYALLAEKNMIVGAVKMLSSENNAELSKEGVLDLDQIQDRTISSTKKFWSTVDKGLFFAFETAERINRGVTYFGAKNKYYSENSKTVRTEVDGKTQKVRVYDEGASEQKAIEYAKGIVSKTQFTFSSVDTPLVLRGDIAKTLLQFQSFNLKQVEFMAEMAKDKNYAGMVRWLVASLLFVYGIGQAFGMKWQDLIPFYSMITGDYNPPPIPAVAVALGKNLMGTTDQFGQPLTLEKRLKNLGNAALPFVPFGSQAKKTIAGIDAIASGEATTIAEKAKALAFGAKGNANAAAGKALDTSLKTAQTKVDGFDKALVDQVRPVFEQAKAAGYGTTEADAAIASLSDNEYTVYKALKAADVAQSNIDLEAKVIPIVQQAYRLGFGTDAANKLISDSFPSTTEGDREYDAYTAAKNSLYGKTQGNESADGATSTSVAGKWDQQNFFQHIGNIAKAIGTDPVTAFNDIFAGNSSWKITGITNGQIIVDRLPMTDSEAIKKARGGQNSEYKLDHIFPVSSGGDNSNDNLQLIPTEQWKINTPVEDYLAKELKAGNISGKQLREFAIRFKAGQGEILSPKYMNEYKEKYGGVPMTAEEIYNYGK